MQKVQHGTPSKAGRKVYSTGPYMDTLVPYSIYYSSFRTLQIRDWCVFIAAWCGMARGNVMIEGHGRSSRRRALRSTLLHLYKGKHDWRLPTWQHPLRYYYYCMFRGVPRKESSVQLLSVSDSPIHQSGNPHYALAHVSQPAHLTLPSTCPSAPPCVSMMLYWESEGSLQCTFRAPR